MSHSVYVYMCIYLFVSFYSNLYKLVGLSMFQE